MSKEASFFDRKNILQSDREEDVYKRTFRLLNVAAKTLISDICLKRVHIIN